MSSSVTRVIVSVDSPPDDSTLVLSLSYQDEGHIYMVMMLEVGISHGSLRIFFGKKKEQRNCARGSQRILLNILKTLEFKSGTGSLKS